MRTKTIKNSLFCVGLRLALSAGVGAFCKTPAVCAARQKSMRQSLTGRFAKRPYWRRSVTSRPTQNKGKTRKNPFSMENQPGL